MRINEITAPKLSKAALENIVWYHGTNQRFTSFDPAHGADGHAKEGPGFYLTTDPDDARGYGSNVMKFRLRIKKLVPLKGHANPAQVRALMNASPELDDVLINWDEDPKRAFATAFQNMMAHDTPKEVFEQVWYDFYRDHAAEWLSEMVKFGYTGIAVPREGVIHFICYDPEALSLVTN